MRVHARPDTTYTSQGRTVLSTGRDGWIHEAPDQGLFVHETRLLSRYRHLIDGEPPQPNAVSNVEQHSWLGYYIRPVPGADPGEADRGSGLVPNVSVKPLEMRVSRYVGEGFHEDIDFTNFSSESTSFQFAIEIDADFAGISETAGERLQAGRLTRSWDPKEGRHETLKLSWFAEHQFTNQEGEGRKQIDRSLSISVPNSDSRPEWDGHSLLFRVHVSPQGQWHACLDFVPNIDGETLALRYGCRSFDNRVNDYDRKRQIFLDEAARLETPESETLSADVVRTLDQAARDLAALRLYDLDQDDRAWTTGAGLPLYIALYGRDTLTAAWQAGLISNDLMKGTLPVLAAWQGTERNDWRDEMPGRMIHEAHTGPLETLNFNPRARSYGSVTTSGLFAFMLSELWHWTGDRELVGPLIEPAKRALAWLDNDAHLTDDIFYAYRTRSEDGVRNQAWKDSADAIRYEDGRMVEPPIASCDEQGFVYIAKLHLSELLWSFGEKELARRTFHEASELKKRFNDAFWMEEEGFFAMALDGSGNQVRSIGSNAGHCLATAIAGADLVERTVSKLFAPDMFTGWGIRTLSSSHPSFNPYSYHLGSVWPVEHGTFALGFMRWGLHDRVQQLARGQFEAATLFDFYRLPELFSGHQRDEDHPFPAIYPNTNSPQAWSSSTVFSFIQAMLGLYPYAPLNALLVDPHLPEWLPEITLHNLRVGKATATIRFRRKKDGSSTHSIVKKKGKLHVIRQPTPWSLTATWSERLFDWITSLVPFR